MSANVVIRTAKKDYVCDCCNRVIHAGEEYLDKVTLNDGKCVRHERYHDECPRDSAPERIVKRLVESGEPLPVHDTKRDIKYNLYGVELWDKDWYARVVEWGTSVARSINVAVLVNDFVDGEGGRL